MTLNRSSPATPFIQILLASYHGAAWIAEQIQSIQRQTFQGWRLLVRDDGSSDATRETIEALAAQDPRIELLVDGRGRLGALHNFGALMEAALQTPAQYFAFADQDDVWHSEKLAWQMECITRVEQAAGRATPVALHTDLSVVDAQLRPIHASFLRYQGLWHVANQPLRTLLIQNFVTGCTLLVNRKLLELATPLPPEALVHDWWLALCAAAAGRLEFLPQATLQYRQHGRNTIGAKAWWSPKGWPTLRQLFRRGGSVWNSVPQARALRHRLQERGLADPATIACLSQYAELPAAERRPVHCLLQLRRLGVRRQGFLRNTILMAAIARRGWFPEIESR